MRGENNRSAIACREPGATVANAGRCLHLLIESWIPRLRCTARIITSESRRVLLTVIAPALRRPARRTGHQQRQRKSDAPRDQQRAERIVLHRFGYSLRSVAQSLAAVLISILGVADGCIAGVARDVLGLAVQILHRACGLAGVTRGLGLSIARHIANGALDFTGDILGRANNSILVHCGSLLVARSLIADRFGPRIVSEGELCFAMRALRWFSIS